MAETLGLPEDKQNEIWDQGTVEMVPRKKLTTVKRSAFEKAQNERWTQNRYNLSESGKPAMANG